MDEQMIEQIAKAIELPFLPHGYELKPHLLKVAARAAHSVMSARLAELEEALKPFADQMTTAELLHNPDRSELTPEHRIERMGERKRERDANILRARAALAPRPKGTDQP